MVTGPMRLSPIFRAFVAAALLCSQASAAPLTPGAAAHIVLGGSFSPPTVEHMSLLTRLMTRFRFRSGKMLVAYPYKAGAAPAEQTESLTRIAVGTVDEVLELDSQGFSGFEGDREEGTARWVGSGGERHTLTTDDSDIRSQNKENTLVTLRHLNAQHGGPGNVYWVSGGDSFSSVPTWMPNWADMFDLAHWVVVARPGFDQGEKDVNFNRHDPLRPVLGAEFIDNYVYSYDEANRVHVYDHRSPGKPSIYVVDQPALNNSSSINRKSLAAGGDYEVAQAGLQPSVFKECLDKKYYVEAPAQAEAPYQLFTRKNLEIYLRWRMARLERSHAAQLTVAEREDLHEMNMRLAHFAGEQATANAKKPKAMALLTFAWEHVTEAFENVRNVRRISQIIREKAREYRALNFARLFVALEIAETAVIPPLMYALLGPKGLLLAPAIHPNEMITLPAFFIYQYLRRRDVRRALGQGSLAYEKVLRDYRNRVLGRDSQAIRARAQISSALGLGGTAVTVNLVRSSLPRWVPLWVRKHYDRRIVWHDLNLSTNELKAILANPGQVEEIQRSAEGSEELFSELLLAAIADQSAMGNAQPQVRLELFLAARLFERMALGQMPRELRGDLSATEFAIMERLGTISQSVIPQASTAAGQIQRVAEMNQLAKDAADVYAIQRVLALHPALAGDPWFWQTVLHQLSTNYPSTTPSGDELAEGRRRLFLVREMMGLPAERPSLPEDIASVARFQKRRITLRAYLTEAAPLMVMAPLPDKAPFRALPLPSRSSGGAAAADGNLLLALDQLEAFVLHHRYVLEESFPRAQQHLNTRPHHRRAEAVFTSAFDLVNERIAAMLGRIEALSFRWAAAKEPHQAGPGASDESTIPGHALALAEYQVMRGEAQELMRQMRTINAFMMGSETIDLTSIDRMRMTVGHTLGFNVITEKARTEALGRGVCASLLTHAARFTGIPQLIDRIRRN